MSNTKRLEGKTAWVTGSSRGIGRAIADHLASLGARVAVHGTTPTSSRAFNEANSLEEVARIIAAAHGASVFPVSGDLTYPDAVRRCAEAIKKEFGKIDILVNNAGGDVGSLGILGKNAGKPLVNDAVFVSLEDVRSIFDRNVMTCILCCREVVPGMIERKSGWIVNIGSVSGLSGHPSEAIYASAKAAVHEYTRCLAAYVRDYNIRANAVAPGLIVVPRIVSQGRADNAPKMTDATLKRPGYPIEIARAVEYLVTDDSSYMSGQVLRLDGGVQLFPA
jgi:3-oxoacyl-[acyl-carrier protein] reductase